MVRPVCHSRDEGGKVDPVLRDDVRVLGTVHTGGVRLHVVLETQFPWPGFRLKGAHEERVVPASDVSVIVVIPDRWQMFA